MQEERKDIYEVKLEKRKGQEKQSVLISNRDLFGTHFILAHDDKRERLVFKKIDSTKEFNLPYGEVEAIEGNFFINKNKKRCIDTRTRNGKFKLLKVKIDKSEDIKLDKDIYEFVTSTSLTYKKLKPGVIEGYRYIVVKKGTKYKPKTQEEK